MWNWKKNVEGIHFLACLNYKYFLNINKLAWDEFEFERRELNSMCDVRKRRRRRTSKFIAYKHHTGVDIKLSYANHISFLRLRKNVTRNVREIKNIICKKKLKFLEWNLYMIAIYANVLCCLNFFFQLKKMYKSFVLCWVEILTLVRI